jgi:hypothetical protein
MSSYAAALSEFYSGEVYGETLFSALAGLARNADERLKWSMLLQLETETKAWLRGAHDSARRDRRGTDGGPGKGSRQGTRARIAAVASGNAIHAR